MKKKRKRKRLTNPDGADWQEHARKHWTVIVYTLTRRKHRKREMARKPWPKSPIMEFHFYQKCDLHGYRVWDNECGEVHTESFPFPFSMTAVGGSLELNLKLLAVNGVNIFPPDLTKSPKTSWRNIDSEWEASEQFLVPGLLLD